MSTNLTDDQILDYYREWSDEHDAQWLGSDEVTVREFRRWLEEEKGVESVGVWEREMLAEYHRQEAE